MAENSPKFDKNRRSSQRRLPRTSVTVEVRKGALGMGGNITGQFLDVSEGGVRVIIKQELKVGSEAELTLTGHGFSGTLKRVATVRWIVKMDDGQFCVGFSFEKWLPYMDVNNLSKP